MSFIFCLDLAGVFIFAISGALAASRTDMDIFGYIVMAMLPAIGGGTLRDIILDAPVFWLSAPIYILSAIAAAFLIFAFPPKVGKRYIVLEWADAIGLSLFCVLGASKTFALTSNITVSVAMGIVTAAAGGMLRDIVINEIPLILRKEIYAIAALFGALVFSLIYKYTGEETFALIIGGTVAFLLRSCGLIFDWSLPKSSPPS